MTRQMIAAALLASALPVLAVAQETASEALPPAGQAPVDDIAPISDAAPDAMGQPDAVSRQMSCRFTTECVDGDCAETEYEGQLTVISDGAGFAEAEWIDPSETLAMSAITAGGATLASLSESTAPAKQRLMTVLDSGEARFTTHLTDPVMSITYAGQCE
ncbi:hypothetical protein SAMN05421538_10479 [Paracoccus isoporae]|uniref:NlpE N-terminal domain-containing protein n=1 Tax=Paracoccus isoporae TaxID=591205 RepID=A0A1G7AD84_9RHOB|nr:hypothetical protein [Paracoccus isoporae]SDE11826.1 hypothetical protein SAMN05421538_10479 [Paracoccus isoporae]